MRKKFIKKIKFLILLSGLVIFTPNVYAISPIISWMMDMYNQPSIKPQEDGTIQKFPEGSVNTEGTIINSNGFSNTKANEGIWLASRNDPNLAPVNPVEANKTSIKNGEYLYEVYCSVCHGSDGMSGTNVGTLRGAPPIAILIQADPTLQQGYVYYKIKYGNIALEGMPSFGFETTEKERWDIVNYVFSKWQTLRFVESRPLSLAHLH